MMKKLKALDLFCGGGGAAIGLRTAGFTTIVGVDIEKRKNYPFDFIQADVLQLPMTLEDFDFVWASPPCQRFSKATRCLGTEKYLEHPDLIEPTRTLLKDHPMTCIENVPQAPIRPDLTLNGPTLGLPHILRKRVFELSFFCWQPTLWKSSAVTFSIRKTLSYTNQAERRKREALGLPLCLPKSLAYTYMGIDPKYPMTVAEIGESVPPKYSEYIARAAIHYMR